MSAMSPAADYHQPRYPLTHLSAYNVAAVVADCTESIALAVAVSDNHVGAVLAQSAQPPNTESTSPGNTLAEAAGVVDEAATDAAEADGRKATGPHTASSAATTTSSLTKASQGRLALLLLQEHIAAAQPAIAGAPVYGPSATGTAARPQLKAVVAHG